MPAAKKFGTFNGVFTPAILTILGVIMYMRLPWIVGQGGLITVVGVILVAHIISVTTGLSVSSIATDKKVKTGGTYYMISRSLGLPIGGTLGVALFIGLSFSVSLYLIGFSESFLGFWGIEITKNNIRLAGSIALLSVTILTFISTSLALKTQLFILAAIILSLVSIFLGEPPVGAETPHLNPITGAAPFIILFGIFFPAVTGFEAGVSMSGDLENPKKSIPVGSISAIVVGLLVYIGMTVYFSYRISPEQLVNNPNILLEVSLFPQLVLAGIWGATLSSALGSILGAPRILQAISIDRITPKFFGVGFGKENEPRNALLLTFVIAEAGILVGELDMIARVVSMFFITTYGFLNLSCAIENWASPDFRPDFKVSKYISLLGALTCLIVMIQLDLVAMVGATILLMSLFFYLKRKELTLESGDTWEGVWSSVVRSGLDYLDKGKQQQRNWRPNIILFSGGSSARPHLLDLGTRLVKKRGLLSSFDLVEVEGARMLFRKSEQSVKEEQETARGLFSRRVECEDVYNAMETISKYYGFSGLEPNTVMMGWARSSQSPQKFVHTITTISDLDYNLLLLSYDEKRGFGQHQQIDVWWRGRGNMIAFAVSLCRFLLSSDEWQNAKVRFLLITDQTALIERLHQVMKQIMEDYRIEASVRIINNAVERKPFYEIIQRESKDADLIINGIPDIYSGEEAVYVHKTNEIIESLGTVLLIRAGSFFEDTYSQAFEGIGETAIDFEPEVVNEIEEAPGIDLPDGPVTGVKRLSGLMMTVIRHFEKESLAKLQQTVEQPLHIFETVVNGTLETLQKQFPRNERIKNHRLLARVVGDLLFQLQRQLADLLAEGDHFKKELLSSSLDWVHTRVQSIPGGVPKFLDVPRSDIQLLPAPGDRISIRFSKFGKRLKKRLTHKPAVSRVSFRALVSQILETTFREAWFRSVNDYIVKSLQLYSDLQRQTDKVVDSLGVINQHLKENPDYSMDALQMELLEIQKSCGKLVEANVDRRQAAAKSFYKAHHQVINTVTEDLSRFDSQIRLKGQRKARKYGQQLMEQLVEVPEHWDLNHQVMMKTLLTDLTLLTFRNRLVSNFRRTKGEIWTEVDQKLLVEMDALKQQMENLMAGDLSIKEFKASAGNCLRKGLNLQESWQQLISDLRGIVNDMPESVDAVLQESLQSVTEPSLQKLELIQIPLRRRLEFIIESAFIGALEDELSRIATGFGRNLNEGQEVIRLLSVGLSDENTTTSGVTGYESLEVIVQDSLNRLTGTRESVMGFKAEFDQVCDLALRGTLESVNLYSIAAFQQVPLMKTRSELWLLQQITSRYRKISEKAGAVITDFIYWQSDLLRPLQRDIEILSSESIVERLTTFVESISPTDETLSALPFYYRHLFLGKPVITKEFWVGRTAELQKSARAIERFKEGKIGGLLVSGDPGSGKTSLCQIVATRHFEKQKIWYLSPPESASCDPVEFEARLDQVLSIGPGSSYRQFQWPKNSVLILDDIGRWFHRKEGGYEVIQRIIRLIEEVSQNCLVLLNANSATYNFLERAVGIEPYLLDIVTCQSLDVKSLQSIILMRHQSSGLKFRYRGKDETEMSSWALARFFTRSIGDCSGNVGVALKKWTRSIQTVSKDHIEISIPQKADLSYLHHLQTDQLHLLINLMIHTRLLEADLEQICGVDSEVFQTHLHILRQTGMLQQDQNQVLEITPFALDYLFTNLKSKGLL